MEQQNWKETLAEIKAGMQKNQSQGDKAKKADENGVVKKKKKSYIDGNKK